MVSPTRGEGRAGAEAAQPAPRDKGAPGDAGHGGDRQAVGDGLVELQVAATAEQAEDHVQIRQDRSEGEAHGHQGMAVDQGRGDDEPHQGMSDDIHGTSSPLIVLSTIN